MDVTNLVGIALGIFGAVGLAGGVVGYFVAARGKAIIELQSEENRIKDEKIIRLEQDKAALVTATDTLKKQNDRLSQDILQKLEDLFAQRRRK